MPVGASKRHAISQKSSDLGNFRTVQMKTCALAKTSSYPALDARRASRQGSVVRPVSAFASAFAAFAVLFAVACGSDDATEAAANGSGSQAGSTENGNGNGNGPFGLGNGNATNDGGSIVNGTDGSTLTGDDDDTPIDSGSTPPKPTRSTGCGKAASASPTDGTSGSVMLGSTKRTFVYYIPQNYDPNRAYPIVFMYHGIGMKTSFMKIWIEMQKYSKNDAIVLFDDGIAAGTWDLSGDKDLVAFDAILDSMNSAFCVDQTRVMALGFSMGAYMANHLACKRASVVKAITAAAGGFPDAPASCGGPVNALIYHKVDDDNENVANGRAARDKWIGLNGCKASPTTPFGSPLKCVEYSCTKAKTVYCEDPKHTPYNHDLDTDYRQPIWDLFFSKM